MSASRGFSLSKVEDVDKNMRYWKALSSEHDRDAVHPFRHVVSIVEIRYYFGPSSAI